MPRLLRAATDRVLDRAALAWLQHLLDQLSSGQTAGDEICNRLILAAIAELELGRSKNRVVTRFALSLEFWQSEQERQR